MLFSPEASEMSRSEPFLCHPTGRGGVGCHPASQGRLPESLAAFFGSGGTPVAWGRARMGVIVYGDTRLPGEECCQEFPSGMEERRSLGRAGTTERAAGSKVEA